MSEMALTKSLEVETERGRETLPAGAIVREVTRAAGGRWYLQVHRGPRWEPCLADEKPEVTGGLSLGALVDLSRL